MFDTYLADRPADLCRLSVGSLFTWLHSQRYNFKAASYGNMICVEPIATRSFKHFTD